MDDGIVQAAQGQPAWFPATHWTLVARAGGDDVEARRQALVELLTRYAPALRLHLVHRNGVEPSLADDLVQEFLTAKVLTGSLIAEAQQGKGRFRTFLLSVLDRFAVSERRKARAKKRSAVGSVSLEAGLEVPDPAPGRPDTFEAAWARELLSTALAAMEQQCQNSGRTDIWGVFQTRVLDPLLGGSEPASYEQLVARFGFKSPVQASNVLVNSKRMFARTLRGLIAEYESDPSRIDEEIADLHLAFARAGR